MSLAIVGKGACCENRRHGRNLKFSFSTEEFANTVWRSFSLNGSHSSTGTWEASDSRVRGVSVIVTIDTNVTPYTSAVAATTLYNTQR